METIYNFLAKLLPDNRTNSLKYWCQTEYGKEWEYAYNFYKAKGVFPKGRDIR